MILYTYIDNVFNDNSSLTQCSLALSPFVLSSDAIKKDGQVAKLKNIVRKT